MAAVTPLLPCFSSSSFPMFAFHVPTPPLNSSYMCLRSRRTRTISSSLVSTGTATATAKRNKVCRAAATTAHKYVKEDYLVKKMSAAEIQELVKGDRSVPLIIDFYTTWCGPCVLMAQELEMLAVEYESSALFVKVDTDDEYEFARDMQVRGLPTLYFISPDSNKDAIRTEGLIPTQMMRDIIDNDM